MKRFFFLVLLCLPLALTGCDLLDSGEKTSGKGNENQTRGIAESGS